MSSWIVSGGENGGCVLRGLEDNEIPFNIDVMVSGPILIEITPRPDWFHKIYPHWTVVGISSTMPILMDYLYNDLNLVLV